MKIWVIVLIALVVLGVLSGLAFLLIPFDDQKTLTDVGSDKGEDVGSSAIGTRSEDRSSRTRSSDRDTGKSFIERVASGNLGGRRRSRGESRDGGSGGGSGEDSGGSGDGSRSSGSSGSSQGTLTASDIVDTSTTNSDGVMASDIVTTTAECVANEDCTNGYDCSENICEDGVCVYLPNRQCEPGYQCTDVIGCEVIPECLVDGDCQDNVGCTEDVCVGGTCSNNPIVDFCQDNYECNVIDGCEEIPECLDDGDCGDGISCTSNSCVDGFCSYAAEDDLCEDGHLCVEGVGCEVIPECLVDNDCDDSDPCNVDSCNSGICEHTVNPNYCTAGFECTSGVGCVEIPECFIDGDCDDGVACTVGSCLDNGCVYEVDDSVCLENYECNVESDCTFVPECLVDSDCSDDEYSCSTSYCDEGICRVNYDHSVCEPHESCLLDEGCVQTSCTGCLNCDNFFGLGCSFEECRQECSSEGSNGCYYDKYRLRNPCYSLGEACEEIDSCEDYSPDECGENRCDVGLSGCELVNYDGQELCVTRTSCGDGVCNGLENCGSCQADCGCDDGLYCNGEENCYEGVCVSEDPVLIDDGNACSVDSCDEDSDLVVSILDDSLCLEDGCGGSCTENGCDYTTCSTTFRRSVGRNQAPWDFQWIPNFECPCGFHNMVCYCPFGEKYGNPNLDPPVLISREFAVGDTVKVSDVSGGFENILNTFYDCSDNSGRFPDGGAATDQYGEFLEDPNPYIIMIGFYAEENPGPRAKTIEEYPLLDFTGDGKEIPSGTQSIYAYIDQDFAQIHGRRNRCSFTVDILDSPISAPDDECVGGCDDGLYCNGLETCDNGVCVSGEPPGVDNNDVGCATSVCDEETDTVSLDLDDSQCYKYRCQGVCTEQGCSIDMKACQHDARRDGPNPDCRVGWSPLAIEYKAFYNLCSPSTGAYGCGLVCGGVEFRRV